MSLNKSPLPLSNVPFIHLSRVTSKSYLIDALYISSRIPIIHQPCISCSNDRYKNDEFEINLKRINQILFGNHFKFNQKCPCKQQQHTHFDNKSKQKQSIPLKKHHNISQKQHQPNTSIASQSIISLSTTKIKTKIDTPRYITSHTRFGKSMLALYFKKYRFISPIDNNKKDEFLQLLKKDV